MKILFSGDANAALATCDKDGMDEKLSGCLDAVEDRLQVLEQSLLGGNSLTDQVSLILVQKVRLKKIKFQACIP